MNFIFILLILSKVVCECCVSALETTTLDSLWKIWKRFHDKHYTNRHEEVIRRQNWNENLVKIHLHNLRYDLGVETYEIGLSRFSDVDWNEFRSWYSVGDKLDIPESSYIDEKYDVNNVGWTPDSYDWRHLNIVNEPRDQGSCIGSYAFAVTASTESQYALHTSNHMNLSVQQFIDCTRIYGNMGCHGGYTFTLFIYLQSFGLETEQMYPFTGEDQDCMANSSDVVVQSIGYKFHRHGYETILKWALYNEGPYVISMNIDEKFLHYKSGIYQSDTCTHYNLNQSMLLVGYGYDNDGIDYWIVQNSWGKKWGESGYVKVRRNNWNMCGIASLAFRPILRGF
uniref:Cathepsin L-like proteinase n=1 Tax=Schistosoma japonicum TaxID=6182 RepID=C1L732_SCHJA|nr:Cathepsin L-like proteinase precursor [Schistosoma japonicum]